jgi:60 kDa SS-A/Ro ribonucleoprotein
MPATALLRNLANLTRIGVFEAKPILELVVSHLKNADIISKSHIHPVSVITAWFTYRSGHGKLSSNTWSPIPEITAALEEMFYLSFKNLTPTGKKLCFLIDCSGSMGSNSLCDGITNAEIAALLAMVFTRAEANAKIPVQHTFYLFSGSTGMFDVSDLIHAKASFDNVLKAVQRSDWKNTDISNGILYVKRFNHIYDGFVVITDNDVNSGIKPSVALQQYRDYMKVPSKMAIVATQLNTLSIADPSDKYMMDFCGFDSHLPKLLQEFLGGKKIKNYDE